jgi:four helix bundle protein
VKKQTKKRDALRLINAKSEYRNPKQIQMTKIRNSKHYDLEDRTLAFAKKTRAFVKKLNRSIANIEDSRQLVKPSGSVGSNYIEANESLSKKDFIMRIKICRKEAKESRYWLRLVDTNDDQEQEKDRDSLIVEATELMNIFGAILQKSQ